MSMWNIAVEYFSIFEKFLPKYKILQLVWKKMFTMKHNQYIYDTTFDNINTNIKRYLQINK